MLKKVDYNLFSIAVIILFYVLLNLLSSTHAFFYDTVQLGASHAWYFYETNFNSIILPDKIDSGHFPIFGIYLAFVWKIFGISLWISHFAMLPFLCITFYFSYKILRHFLPYENIAWAYPILLLEPTYVAQSSLVSPDIALIAFFMMSLYYILINNRRALLFSLLLLSVVSMRGMMTFVGLYFFDCFITFYYSQKSFASWIQHGLVYVPSAVVFILFNAYHYHCKGWIGYHPLSEWAYCFAPTTWPERVRNIGILFWRWIDFGRVFLYLTVFLLSRKVFTYFPYNRPLRLLIFLFFSISLVLSYSPIFYKNLNNHRYLLPVFFSFALLTIYVIHISIQSLSTKYIFGFFLAAALITGHLWRYPTGVAVGWDCTLAHTPIYALRTSAEEFIQNQHLPKNKIGTYFPIKSIGKYTYLNALDTFSYSDFDIAKNKYILYSNICNDFSDSDIESIKKMNPIFYKKDKNIEIIIVKNELLK